MKELQDILPGKKVAFINKCIETYGPKVDVIMNNIIEGNIIDESEVAPVEVKKIHVPNKDVLEDKEHVALLKATLFADDVDELGYDMYDDEYDDTYDSHNVGATDIDDMEELTSRRSVHKCMYVSLLLCVCAPMRYLYMCICVHACACVCVYVSLVVCVLVIVCKISQSW